MPVRRFTASNFRCLEQIEFEPAADYNLIHGDNASGKTSILEALAYLGRGKSFRGASSSDIIRHGERELLLFGEVQDGEHLARVGVRNSSEGLEVRIDGRNAAGSAALAAVLPLQVIDPDVHELVAGAPEQRRRYLDWIAFHVEPGYLDVWRRFRRALKQRNAALRSGAPLDGWNTEFTELALKIDAGRRDALAAAEGSLASLSEALLGEPLAIGYQPGWSHDRSLAEALEAGEERDRLQGSTQYGPQRSDLKLRYNERLARKLVSRGQQKLLACAMILGAAETAQTALERPLLLLLDDPAAELDAAALQRLMAAVTALGCQVVATSLAPTDRLFPAPAALFHVEHGVLTAQT